MTTKQASRLKRDLNPMPDAIKQTLQQRGLLRAYEDRPPYQRNDYLGWISRAKLATTQEKRLQQMLDELEQGDVYMKMVWRPKQTESR